MEGGFSSMNAGELPDGELRGGLQLMDDQRAAPRAVC
jgi:hypothetical protein